MIYSGNVPRLPLRICFGDFVQQFGYNSSFKRRGQGGKGGEAKCSAGSHSSQPTTGILEKEHPQGTCFSCLWIKSRGRKTVTPSCLSASRIEGFHMETSSEDSWITCCFPPPSGKLLLITLRGTVGQSSACQMHHACHLETLAKLILLLASIV